MNLYWCSQIIFLHSLLGVCLGALGVLGGCICISFRIQKTLATERINTCREGLRSICEFADQSGHVMRQSML